MEGTMTANDAALLMCCSVQAARDRLRRGGVKPIGKSGRTLVYREVEVKAYFREHPSLPQIAACNDRCPTCGVRISR